MLRGEPPVWRCFSPSEPTCVLTPQPGDWVPREEVSGRVGDASDLEEVPLGHEARRRPFGGSGADGRGSRGGPRRESRSLGPWGPRDPEEGGEEFWNGP